MPFPSVLPDLQAIRDCAGKGEWRVREAAVGSWNRYSNVVDQRDYSGINEGRYVIRESMVQGRPDITIVTASQSLLVNGSVGLLTTASTSTSPH